MQLWNALKPDWNISRTYFLGIHTWDQKKAISDDAIVPLYLTQQAKACNQSLLENWNRQMDADVMLVAKRTLQTCQISHLNQEFHSGWNKEARTNTSMFRTLLCSLEGQKFWPLVLKNILFQLTLLLPFQISDSNFISFGSSLCHLFFKPWLLSRFPNESQRGAMLICPNAF